jgi:predicted nucleic acid-binding protein
MRAYADTSFLVKLVTDEPGSEGAMAEFRRVEFPPLFFLSLHGLEVTNAVRHRAFHLRHSASAQERAAISRERDVALGRIEQWVRRGWFTEVEVDWEAACDRARELSRKHTERLGCRGFDLLHVAFALELQSEVFLTSDKIQGALAAAENLEVTVSPG